MHYTRGSFDHVMPLIMGCTFIVQSAGQRMEISTFSTTKLNQTQTQYSSPLILFQCNLFFQQCYTNCQNPDMMIEMRLKKN